MKIARTVLSGGKAGNSRNCRLTYRKYVSELLGKETLDTNTYGKSKGRSGSYSTNYQSSGRELLSEEELLELLN